MPDRYIGSMNPCPDPVAGDQLWIEDASASETDKDRRVDIAKFGILNAGAASALRVRRVAAAGQIAGAGPLDIAYATISAQLDLPTAFTASGIFDVELFVGSASQSGYGRVTLLAYQSGGQFAGVATCGTQIGGSLGMTVTPSVVGGALRLTLTGNTTITNINWRVWG